MLQCRKRRSREAGRCVNTNTALRQRRDGQGPKGLYEDIVGYLGQESGAGGMLARRLDATAVAHHARADRGARRLS